eukprot:246287_1
MIAIDDGCESGRRDGRYRVRSEQSHVALGDRLPGAFRSLCSLHRPRSTFRRRLVPGIRGGQAADGRVSGFGNRRFRGDCSGRQIIRRTRSPPNQPVLHSPNTCQLRAGIHQHKVRITRAKCVVLDGLCYRRPRYRRGTFINPPRCADVMVAGSAESGAASPLAIAGFCRCRALSTWKGEPSLAARPFARGRDGFVMGEGAGALVLEEREHARRRGAHIYAELVGFGLSGDGHHITEPDPEGRGSRAAMMGALSGFDARRVGYINAHATSTPVGDAVENRAIKEVFGSHAYSLAVSSTKAATGHGLGAAGAIEAVLAVKALQSGRAPPTLNCSDREAEFDLNYVAEQAQDLPGLEAVMSNSFGFGGTNSSLIFVAA